MFKLSYKKMTIFAYCQIFKKNIIFTKSNMTIKKKTNDDVISGQPLIGIHKNIIHSRTNSKRE